MSIRDIEGIRYPYNPGSRSRMFLEPELQRKVWSWSGYFKLLSHKPQKIFGGTGSLQIKS